MTPAYAATAMGELEGRPAPVALRRCVAGANAGQLCKENAECPGSTCVDRNVFNITVAVQFNASNAEINRIRDVVSAASAVLFDVTDGQAEFGEAFIYNNAFGTAADLRIYPSSSPTWWGADTGSWKTGGSIHVSMNFVNSASAPGEVLAHEFIHLAFDARDEYESRTVGCGGNTGGFSCPDSVTIAAGEHSCLMDKGGTGAMDGPQTELCWGHGNPSDLTDLSGGNHDADLVTEQSRCRSNRSCWDQVVWSYPNTFLMPAGAPDPDANGATVNATNFVLPSITTRVVLVLDESGSMNSDTPTRLSRLKVAANDFVSLAQTGTELGIVSYSSSANPASHQSVAIAALPAARAPWSNAVNALSAGGATNIGDGLQKAWDMIVAAGGVTANTFIVLMTDGKNNMPPPQATADADLQAKVANLLAQGVPVFVTCTGSDLTLDSQCAEIATGTNGFYVDSADAGGLPESFVDIHEKIAGYEPIVSQRGHLFEAKPQKVYVERGSESVTFTLIWDNPSAGAAMLVIDPAGKKYEGASMPQGRYFRVSQPREGQWQLIIDPRGKEGAKYLTRVYTRNQIQSLVAASRYPTVKPEQEMYIYAYPRSYGGQISHPEKVILAEVTRPDGSTDKLELHDRGRDKNGEGDDLYDDGIFTGVYRKTGQKGAYDFLLRTSIEGWPQSGDRQKRDESLKSPRFDRESRVTVVVADPKDVTDKPEDPPTKDDPKGEKNPRIKTPTFNPVQPLQPIGIKQPLQLVK